MSVDVRDLHWAAGFLEGEGCFHFSKAKHLQVSVAQVNKEPLDRLRRVFGGGSIYLHRHDKEDHPNWNAIYRLSFVGNRAAGICMTLFPMMTIKRQGQIRVALNGWKAKRVKGIYAHKCTNGHPYTEDNVYLWKGKRLCRTCRSYNDQIRRGWRAVPRWENRHPGERLNFQCKRGHDLIDESNLYWWSGKRYCIACRRIKKAEFDEKKRQSIRSDGA